MGDPKGFIKFARKESGNRPVNERLGDFSEVEQTLAEEDRKFQASRCMDCGIPFCHWACPVINTMPEWQDAIFRGNWEEAINILHSTNNFPEFTGRICPAPCEDACVLNLHKEPVTIRENEAAAAEQAFARGYIKPRPPARRTGKSVAVIGSGPAGLACADLLNKAGHLVTIFEKDEAPGGLLRFGIPDFKLSKRVIDRRIKILLGEGIQIRTGMNVTHPDEIPGSFDAICLAVGAMKPRNLEVSGRELKGIHFAMEYLTAQNRLVAGSGNGVEIISAKGKDVLVIGGGDTGSDCVGTANRQKARSVTQIEIMPKPGLERSPDNPWPFRANTFKASSSHEEGCTRMWNISTLGFRGKGDQVAGADIAEVKWVNYNDGKMVLQKLPGTEKTIKTQLVLLAMGFVHPVHEGLLNSMGMAYDSRGNIKVSEKLETNSPGIFATGDCVQGAGLVVTAIAMGRRTAFSIIDYLK
jgi:glutamate synthase (NADPH) small chain